MHILNLLPQRLDAGATPTFAGITGTNGQTIGGNSSGAWAITANGTNQNITLTPSGSGLVDISSARVASGVVKVRSTSASGYSSYDNYDDADTQMAGFGYGNASAGNAQLAGRAYVWTNSRNFSFVNGSTNIFTAQTNGRFLLGTGNVDSGALLQVGTNTTNLAGGMIFGTDVGFYRSDAQALGIAHIGGTNPLFHLIEGTTKKFQLGTNTGDVYFDSLTVGKNIYFRSGNQTLALTLDSSQGMAHSGSTVVFNGSAAGAVTSSTRFRKAVTAIGNASATAVLTVTIPNAAHSASLNVYLTGSLGAGGAIGANEASAAIGYTIAISRTAGVNAVAVASTAFGSATAAVAGAATCTITAVVSAISGAVGATNTFTVNVTISRGSGSSTNHTCQVTAELDNANATGVTLA